MVYGVEWLALAIVCHRVYHMHTPIPLYTYTAYTPSPYLSGLLHSHIQSVRHYGVLGGGGARSPVYVCVCIGV
jgi:hypothetical protein